MHHELHTQIQIDAPPEAVWQVLVDLDRYPEWNPFIVSAVGRVEVGERLTNRLQPPGGRGATFRPKVTVAETATTFEWLGRFGLPGLFDGRHRFQLTRTERDGTLLTHAEKFDGLLVRFLRTSLDTTTKAGFEAMNDALRARVEATVGCTS